MANDGEIHALKKLVAKQSECILELGKELGEVSTQLANNQNILRALKNPDMLMDGMPLTLDRIQVMETGDIRIIKPTPAPITETCVKAPEPDKNGKKPEPAKEAVNV